MAATLAARRLTDAHRTAQARLSAQTVARLLLVWPLLDSGAIDASTGRWLTAAVPVVEQAHSASAQLAAAYLRRLSTIETGVPPASIPTVLPSIERITTSLVVQGPVAFKSAISTGRTADLAFQVASQTSSAAGTRQALAGGRDLLQAAAQADQRIVGMIRVTSPGACEFCRTIANYSLSNPNLGGDFQCHDNCHCQPQPLYG